MAIDYTSIDEVINDFQLMIDDTSYDKDAHIYQLRLLALQGLRELKFDAEQEVKTTTLLVSSTTLQCTLPDDFVKMNRIGYRSSNEDGFVSLGYKSDLTLDSSVAAEVGNDNFDENNPYYHTDVGRKFGVGGGNNTLGYYRLNRNDNTINFSSDLAGKTVFMEYISDGIGNGQSRSHILELDFNAADFQRIVNGTTLLIPSPITANASYTFYFGTQSYFDSLSTSLSTANTIILPNQSTDEVPAVFNPQAGNLEVAEIFSTFINRGRPQIRLSRISDNLSASHVDGTSKVLLIYSNLSFVPLQIGSSFDSNFNSSTNASLARQISLKQLGIAGTTPRVHKFCEEALRCYIYYKYIQRKRGIPANEKQMAKRAYYNEKRLARARMMNFNKEAAMQVSRKAYKQSPKL